LGADAMRPCGSGSGSRWSWPGVLAMALGFAAREASAGYMTVSINQ
jgi:hypothetical protein